MDTSLVTPCVSLGQWFLSAHRANFVKTRDVSIANSHISHYYSLKMLLANGEQGGQNY